MIRSTKLVLLRNLLVQLSLIIPVFFLFFIFQFCIMSCNSVAYGMAISLLNEIVSLLVAILGQKIIEQKPKQGVALFFVFAAVRFVMIGALFAVGIAVLGLDALTMLLAFVVLHLSGQIINLIFNLK